MVMVVFAAALVASIVITLPETISSPFVLMPGRGADPIRSTRSGVVAAVRITEGQAIVHGTPAFVIRSAAAGDRSAEMRSLETQMSGAEESRINTKQRFESQRRADLEEERRLSVRAANLRDKLAEQRGLRDVREARFKRDLEIQGNDIEITEREIGFKKTQYTVAKELSDRLERYYKDGSISWLEYNNRKLEATKLEVERQQLERTLESSKLKLSQMRSEHQTWEIDWKLSVAAMQSGAGRDAGGAGRASPDQRRPGRRGAGDGPPAHGGRGQGAHPGDDPAGRARRHARRRADHHRRPAPAPSCAWRSTRRARSCRTARCWPRWPAPASSCRPR